MLFSRRRRGLILALILLLVVAVAALLLWQALHGRRSESHRPTPPPPPTRTRPPLPPVASEEEPSWRLDVDGVEEFSGTLLPEEAGLIPAGASGSLRAPGTDLCADPSWQANGGSLTAGTDGRLSLVAPTRPGAYAFTCRRPEAAEARLLVFVLYRGRLLPGGNTPDPSVLLDGRRPIGPFPRAEGGPPKVRAHPAAYAAPLYFLPITPETEPLRLSRHLTVGEYVARPKRAGAGAAGAIGERHIDVFPPSRPLLRKLEALADEIEAQGLRFESFSVESGFRTPAYNRKVAQSAKYSLHVYGRALDVLIDEAPRDGRMDDLNHDGREDWHDAQVLALALARLEKAQRVEPGGIGLYEYAAPDSVGSHVHFDVRGVAARWGTTYRTKTGRPGELKWWSNGAGGEAGAADED